MKLKQLAYAVGLMATAGLVQAGPLPLFEHTLFQDDNRDYQANDTNGNGILDVGDTLRAVIEIAALEDADGIAPSRSLGVGGKPELTGISEIQVISKNIISHVDLGGGEGYDIGTISFGPSASFVAEVGGVAGAMVALWTDSTPDLDLPACTDITSCEAAAKNDTLLAIAGIDALDGDNGWMTSIGFMNVTAGAAAFLGTGGIDNIAYGATLNAADKLTTFNFALSILVGNPGLGLMEEGENVTCALIGGCAGNGKADIVGSGDALGGSGLTNGYDLRSDTDFQARFVPEPASLALLGLGLLGLAAVRRKA